MLLLLLPTAAAAAVADFDDDDGGGGVSDGDDGDDVMNVIFNLLKLSLFLYLLLDPKVDYGMPHENELQSTYHDWGADWANRHCTVKSKDPSVDAVNEKKVIAMLISVWWRYLRW